MTDEDKKLLLKDLCARLPYGVLCVSVGEPRKLLSIEPSKDWGVSLDGGDYMPHTYPIEEIKPYLRSFKSMTKDERSEYYKRCKSYHYRRTWKYGRNQYGEILYKKEPMSYTAFYRTPEALDYLNSIHVDYRGLIKKGLAWKAEPGMYDNTENEANR